MVSDLNHPVQLQLAAGVKQGVSNWHGWFQDKAGYKKKQSRRLSQVAIFREADDEAVDQVVRRMKVV